MTQTPQKQVDIVHHKASMVLPEIGESIMLPQKSLTLARWASRYMDSEVIGVQSPNTERAKKRDLQSFMGWFFEQNSHLAIEDWHPRDTQAFMNNLESNGQAPTSINRTFATLRHFARWAHEQKTPFIAGLPTRGIKEREVDEPDAKKLSPREIHRLFKAADKLVITDTRKNARPRRNRAILALLYYTGLRVSELCALRLDQYNEKHLVNVKRKGRTRTRKIYLSTGCRNHLVDYLESERRLDDLYGADNPLMLTPGSAAPINRSTVWRALEKLAHEATTHTKDQLKIHPHRLRTAPRYASDASRPHRIFQR